MWLAHGAANEKCGSLRQIIREARSIARRLHCTAEDVASIIEKCTGTAKKSAGSDEDSTGSAYGGLIACLVKEYGSTPDYWLYEATADMVAELMEQFTKRVEGEAKAARSACASKGKAVAPSATPRIRALKEFREKRNEIEQLWSSKNGD